jgi:tetratricopeptide (TPR) repeat protein
MRRIAVAMPCGVIAGGLMLLAVPAFGASQKAHDDCNADDPDRNIAGCTRIIEDRGESKRIRGIAYVGRAIAWRQKGDLDRAIEEFTKGIRINPLPRNDLNARPFINIYLNRASAWHAKGDLDRAVSDYDQANRLEPNEADIYHLRGVAWRQKGDPERAIADFTAAIQLDPRHANAYYMRGQILLAMGERERATADLSAAMRLQLAQ